MIFSGKLKVLRGNLTQTAFAKKLGIPQNTYHRYEKGERVPDINALSKISKSLNISADELLGLADLKHSTGRNGHLSNSNLAFDTKDATIAKQAETIVTLTRSLKKIVDSCTSRG
ncbi:MAG: helix-turn-helix transcriptional regulator [bacterium]